ncbi:Uncharacterised protein [Bordetella pertussis]|nr:Uncharacterised protein [Bordetella pertussis]
MTSSVLFMSGASESTEGRARGKAWRTGGAVKPHARNPRRDAAPMLHLNMHVFICEYIFQNIPARGMLPCVAATQRPCRRV